MTRNFFYTFARTYVNGSQDDEFLYEGNQSLSNLRLSISAELAARLRLSPSSIGAINHSQRTFSINIDYENFFPIRLTATSAIAL